MKKEVVAPITSQGFHRPYFVVFKNKDKLYKTKRGPLELKEKKKPFKFSSIDLVLVPGLGFDRFGYRLGYGGGVYDRILGRTAKAYHVGLFFSHQELKKIPVGKSDRPMDFVFTEEQEFS